MSDLNTSQVSGRISEEDFNFLMEFPLPGKVTVSEKLRHVCSFFRTYHQGMNSYPDCLAQLQSLLQAGARELKDAESGHGLHSDLVDRLLLALPEAMAMLVTYRKPARKEDQLKSLLQAEERLLNWSLSVLDAVLRMGLTRSAPAYNPRLLEGRLERVLELLEIIAARK
jgi:hypothetical protein